MNTIILTLNDGVKKEYIRGVKLRDIIIDSGLEDIICAKFDNQIINLDDTIMRSGKLDLYSIYTNDGIRIYERGLTFLFKVSAMEVLGKNVNIRVRFSIGKGIFFQIDKTVTDNDIIEIKKAMKDKVSKAIPFVRVDTSINEAMNYFHNIKREDKVRTLFYERSDYVTLYRFDGIYNYIMGELPLDSSILKYFDLYLIKDKGIILGLPSIYDEGKVVKYKHHEQYFSNTEAYLDWAKLFNVSNLGELNDVIVHTKPADIINLCETIQDYKLKEIAAIIKFQMKDVKVILLSGPSSSGKTTTARKLSLNLRTLGLKPVAISLDDYFLDRKETPLGENGKPDFESIRAIDIKLFNNQIAKLLKGNKVKGPVFNFITGEKEFIKDLYLGENDVLIVEGLHAVSSELLKDIPRKNKYKIYISPLVYLNIDDDNRINQTDIRLLRRMVRDNRTRGYNPSHTLSNWASVRDGEEKYVFPYQDEADVVFNTFLAYELAIFKVYLLPLLYTVKSDDPEYLTALRLIRLLDFILPMPSEDVPSTSILREFIGASYFEK